MFFGASQREVADADITLGIIECAGDEIGIDIGGEYCCTELFGKSCGCRREVGN